MDRKTQDAVIRNFEVIGEACNNVTRHHAQFAAAHTEIPWNFAYEMRNALAHGYFKVDQNIVWRTDRSRFAGVHQGDSDGAYLIADGVRPWELRCTMLFKPGDFHHEALL